jgi:RNA polymerase-binding transcription factor DksA
MIAQGPNALRETQEALAAAEAERAGLSRHLEDSQAEVARLRDACEGWESLAHAAEEREDERFRLRSERDAVRRQVAAVRALHAPDAWGMCETCGEQVAPCATIRALDTEEE